MKKFTAISMSGQPLRAMAFSSRVFEAFALLKRTATLLGIAFALASATNTNAAFFGLPSPTPETPGVTLDPVTGPLTGTVLATLDSPFADNATRNGMPDPFATGTLYSLVVDRGGGQLDYYYQLVNTTGGVFDIADTTKELFRIKSTGGFNPSLAISVAQTGSLVNLSAGSSNFDINHYLVGGKPAATADRDVATAGSIGFDFPVQPPIPFIGDPRNISQGEASAFLVVRTNSTQFGLEQFAISGAATSFASAFAPVPEPDSLVTVVMGAGGVGIFWRRKHPRSWALRTHHSPGPLGLLVGALWCSALARMCRA